MRLWSPNNPPPNQAQQGPSLPAGIYWGMGFRQPFGRMRSSSSPGYRPVTPANLKIPPTKVV